MPSDPSDFRLPARLTEESLPQRYQQPGFFAECGQLDRRLEGAHVARMRELQRQAIEDAAYHARREFNYSAWLHGRARAGADTKYQIFRNQKESEGLAGDDPIMRAQFGVIDDDIANDARLYLRQWKPSQE
ncbi:MAG: hypothetical protein JWL72_1192 [Ilumatobacteraceae bacterium]|nr:hypothetical protein [Ilumatobacteraceae bacterium]